jgi:hypothetical protein
MSKRKMSKSMYDEAYKNKDSGGVSRKTFMDWNKFDNKPEWYNPKKGTNYINIVPYEIKSKLHPMVKAGKASIGELDFMLDVYVHRYTGPNNDTDVLCPKRNYGKPCPICEQAKEYYDSDKKDEAKQLNASRRVLLNVQPIIDDEPGKLGVFDVSHYLFMKELMEEAHECKNGEDLIPFADPEKGSVIRFRGSEKQFGKNDYLEYKSFRFEKRQEEISDEVIDEAFSFDTGLILLSYDEIKAIFYGMEVEEGEDTAEATAEATAKAETKEEKSTTLSEEKKEPVEEKKETKDTKCPHGHGFGTCEKHDECNDCDDELWEECDTASKTKK